MDSITEVPLKCIPLARRSEEAGGGPIPLMPLARNLEAGCASERLERARAYWAGWPATDAERWEAVRGGQLVGVLPHANGLVVLDCDIRGEWEPDPAGRGVRLVEYHGTDDLAALAKKRGKELPATYTVKSKGGGRHLYFRVNNSCPVRSRGQRPGWRIDVKASENTWVVAPPSPGYTVLDDRRPVVLPNWLARAIVRLGDTHPMKHAGGSGSLGSGSGALTDVAREGIMRYVAKTNVSGGGWNNALYWGACRMAESGMSAEETMDMLMTAAAPWSEAERRRAERTVTSGWNRVLVDAQTGGSNE